MSTFELDVAATGVLARQIPGEDILRVRADGRRGNVSAKPGPRETGNGLPLRVALLRSVCSTKNIGAA